MTPNKYRLKAVLAHIEAHPEEWCQARWHCGTTHCFAGHARLMFSGRNIDAIGWKYMGRMASVDAKKALGLTGMQAGNLFHRRNTLEDLRDYVAVLCGEKQHDQYGYDKNGRDKIRRA